MGCEKSGITFETSAVVQPEPLRLGIALITITAIAVVVVLSVRTAPLARFHGVGFQQSPLTLFSTRDCPEGYDHALPSLAQHRNHPPLPQQEEEEAAACDRPEKYPHD